jgi:hypothetical protein
MYNRRDQIYPEILNNTKCIYESGIPSCTTQQKYKSHTQLD